MVTDAVDYGAVRTGAADYGSYFGLWKLGTKIARAIAAAVGATNMVMGSSRVVVVGF